MTPTRMPTLLIVEDSDVYRAMLRVYVQDVGVLVLEASDGDEALQVLDRQDVDLVVADLNMARVGGLELLAAMRRHARPAVRGARFVLLTAEETGTQHFAEAEHAPADAFATKPVKPRAFRDLVHRLITAPSSPPAE